MRGALEGFLVNPYSQRIFGVCKTLVQGRRDPLSAKGGRGRTGEGQRKEGRKGRTIRGEERRKEEEGFAG